MISGFGEISSQEVNTRRLLRNDEERLNSVQTTWNQGKIVPAAGNRAQKGMRERSTGRFGEPFQISYANQQARSA